MRLVTATLIISGCLTVLAQVQIAGDCNSVRVTQAPSRTLYSNTLFAPAAVGNGSSNCDGNSATSECRMVTFQPNMEASYTLFQVLANQQLVQVGQPRSTNFNSGFLVFNNLPHGTYRVVARLPVISRDGCSFDNGTNYTCMFDWSGRHIGFLGTYNGPNSGSGATFTSNDVVVGPTTSADNVFTIIESQPSGPTSAADANETLIVDFSQSRNYNLYHIDVVEDNNGVTGYASLGWQQGTIQNLNLSQFWLSTGQGPIRPFHGYTVKFVTENLQCRNAIEWTQTTRWNDRSQSIFICPAGTGCLRLNVPSGSIHAFPNPARDQVRLSGIDESSPQARRIQLVDALGRVVRDEPLQGDTYSLEGMATGVYVLRLFADEEIVHTQQLLIED